MISNNYREIKLSCSTSSLSFNLIARVYDGSVAFRYEISAPEQKISNIKKENSAFSFGQHYTLYQYNQESIFTPVSIDTFNKTCDLPATLTNGKIFISVGEANNDNYTKTKLKRGTIPHSLTLAFVRNPEVKVTGSFLTPWRTISVSKTAIGLHEYSQLNLKLNPLALTVVYFSPLQSIFWYGNPNDYTNEEEIEILKFVPAVWNESHYLAGDIGKNISVARRKGNTWFIGSAAGLMDWKSTVSLNFLSAEKNYSSTVYEDDRQGNIRKRTLTVKKGDMFPIDLKAKEGQAVIIEVR